MALRKSRTDDEDDRKQPSGPGINFLQIGRIYESNDFPLTSMIKYFAKRSGSIYAKSRVQHGALTDMALISDLWVHQQRNEKLERLKG